MNDTGALPDLHIFPPGLPLHPVAEVDIGRNRIGLSAGIEFTISTALREVQRMSLSAFTSTDVLM